MKRVVCLAVVAAFSACGNGQPAVEQYATVPPSIDAHLGKHRAGSLDATFGNHGRVVLSLAMPPVAAAVQSDGEIIVLGNVPYGGSQLVRLLRRGKLDKSFGRGGVVTLNMYVAYGLAVQSDGKLLVGGIAAGQQHAELVRVDTDGSLDKNFGDGGIVQFDYLSGTSNAVLTVLVQSDDKIVAGGFALSQQSDAYLTSLARFDSNGTFDPNFGTNGVVALNLVGGVTAIGLLRNRDILVCGGFIDPSSSLFARFRPDGILDRSDRSGALISEAHTGSLTFEGSNEFLLDGKLLQWETANESSKQLVLIRRLRRNQSPDGSFHSTPFAFGSSLSNAPEDVETASDGALIVAGRGTEQSGLSVFGVARLLASGRLDASFGDRGTVVTEFPREAEGTALAVAPDGKIVVAGVLTGSGSSVSLALARYLAK